MTTMQMSNDEHSILGRARTGAARRDAAPEVVEAVAADER